MKIKVWVSMGPQCKQKQVIEIDDAILEGEGDDEREDIIDDEAREAMLNMIDWGWEEVDD